VIHVINVLKDSIGLKTEANVQHMLNVLKKLMKLILTKENKSVQIVLIL